MDFTDLRTVEANSLSCFRRPDGTWDRRNRSRARCTIAIFPAPPSTPAPPQHPSTTQHPSIPQHPPAHQQPSPQDHRTTGPRPTRPGDVGNRTQDDSDIDGVPLGSLRPVRVASSWAIWPYGHGPYGPRRNVVPVSGRFHTKDATTPGPVHVTIPYHYVVRRTTITRQVSVQHA